MATEESKGVIGGTALFEDTERVQKTRSLLASVFTDDPKSGSPRSQEAFSPHRARL